jgi:uncharacterized membrane protein
MLTGVIAPRPKLRWYQFSLQSLLVLSTAVAAFCSVSVSAHWSVAITIVVGVALCYGGYYLDLDPRLAGKGASRLGCFVRLIGLLLTLVGLLAFGAMLGLHLSR